MPIPSFARALRRLILPALLVTAAPAALAQYPAGATVQPLPQAGDPAELLATALRTLAVEPNNLAALTAAGHNALVLGDPNAAVGFFGRAQEIAPRDGHVKAGLGSALIELEKPQDALRLFAEASRLGIPDDEIAEDRGLAYDLTGDPQRAQHDYMLVLGAHPENDTVRRRLALSQGISGEKAAAIATLDPLIRKRDIAGWRAQTFVLAMNGDAKGASEITHIMLPQQADMLQPFLVRLASLSPADKARAVNFGEMPTSGRSYTPTELANSGTAPTYAPAANAARPASAPQASPRSSDLAPVSQPRPQLAAQSMPAPAPPAQPTTVVAKASTPPHRTIASRGDIFALGQPPYEAAPLARIALSPAEAKPTPTPGSTPTEPAATQIVPTRVAQGPTAAPATVSTAPATVPVSAPAQVAEARPTPVQPSGPPAPDLPTPAAVGHYDLPHDAVRAAPRSAVAVAPSTTVGTPVVHAEAASTAPASESKATRLASAASRKPASPASADDTAPPALRRRHDVQIASADTDDTTSRRHTVAHPAPSAATDVAVDGGGGGKGRKPTRGRAAARDDEDQPEDAGTAARGKRSAAVDSDRSSASRKDAHGSKRAAADDLAPDDGKGRKGKHGRSSSSQDGDAGATKSSKKDDTRAAPERVFVQVAGGANKDDMDKAWAGLKKKAPDLLKGHTPQTAPVHATNRLLVGPFKSADEAQAFVNKMAAKGLSGFTVKTPKGTKVEKVDSGQ